MEMLVDDGMQGLLICSKCKMTFNRKDNYQKHVNKVGDCRNNVNSNKSYVCICGDEFSCYAKLDTHHKELKDKKWFMQQEIMATHDENIDVYELRRLRFKTMKHTRYFDNGDMEFSLVDMKKQHKDTKVRTDTVRCVVIESASKSGNYYNMQAFLTNKYTFKTESVVGRLKHMTKSNHYYCAVFCNVQTWYTYLNSYDSTVVEDVILHRGKIISFRIKNLLFRNIKMLKDDKNPLLRSIKKTRNPESEINAYQYFCDEVMRLTDKPELFIHSISGYYRLLQRKVFNTGRGSNHKSRKYRGCHTYIDHEYLKDRAVIRDDYNDKVMPLYVVINTSKSNIVDYYNSNGMPSIGALFDRCIYEDESLGSDRCKVHTGSVGIDYINALIKKYGSDTEFKNKELIDGRYIDFVNSCSKFGMVVVNPKYKDEIVPAVAIDVNSMYLALECRYLYPYGNSVKMKYDGKGSLKDYIYTLMKNRRGGFITVELDVNLKSGKFPIIASKDVEVLGEVKTTGYGYITSGRVKLRCTCVDFINMIHCYDVHVIKFCGGVEFSMKKANAEWQECLADIHNTRNKAKRMNAPEEHKEMLGSAKSLLYGDSVKSVTNDYKELYVNGKLYYKKLTDDEIHSEYQMSYHRASRDARCGLFTVSYAKSYMLSVIDKVGIDNVIYSMIDSLIVKADTDLSSIDLSDTDFGKFSLRDSNMNVCVKGHGLYCMQYNDTGDIKVVSVGVPPEQYKKLLKDAYNSRKISKRGTDNYSLLDLFRDTEWVDGAIETKQDTYLIIQKLLNKEDDKQNGRVGVKSLMNKLPVIDDIFSAV